MTTNGLDQLNELREKRKTRSIPPSRNAAPSVTQPAETNLRREDVSSEPDVPRNNVDREDNIFRSTSPADGVSLEPLSKYSIYFDTSTDDFLEAVRVAGRRARPKLDASRSAVARLAVDRLARDLSPEEVLVELRARSSKQDRAGRKRL